MLFDVSVVLYLTMLEVTSPFRRSITIKSLSRCAEDLEAELQLAARNRSAMEDLEAELQQAARNRSATEDLEAELQQAARNRSATEDLEAELQQAARYRALLGVERRETIENTSKPRHWTL